MSINMELTGAPSPYGTPTLIDRGKTSAFLDWQDITAATDVTVSSPDLSDIVQELVDLPDWTENSSVSVILNPNSATPPTLLRAFQTSTGPNKPELEITWTQDNSSADIEDQQLVTGMRFNFIHVPPGAQITHCLLYTSPSPRDQRGSRMPSSA